MFATRFLLKCLGSEFKWTGLIETPLWCWYIFRHDVVEVSKCRIRRRFCLSTRPEYFYAHCHHIATILIGGWHPASSFLLSCWHISQQCHGRKLTAWRYLSQPSYTGQISLQNILFPQGQCSVLDSISRHEGPLFSAGKLANRSIFVCFEVLSAFGFLV